MAGLRSLSILPDLLIRWSIFRLLPNEEKTLFQGKSPQALWSSGLGDCGRLNNGPLSWTLEHLTMSPYMEKGTLQMR